MIDLLSDTVTKPSSGMLKAMMNAQVGDDVFDEDPTVNALQDKVAELFGVEAALYCTSGTMTNQIAIKVHTQPGDEVICHHHAHIYNYEGGGMMFNSGVSAKLIGNPDGLFTADQAAGLISRPGDIHAARTKMIEIENTSNKGGGTCYRIADLKPIETLARKNNLAFHLDGARLFNALVRNGESAQEYGKLFDSISICLSKGLGCPVGSLLLGTKDFIGEAKFIRKRFGGAWRQAGFTAAAGIYALDNNIERLAEDHAKAKKLEASLWKQEYIAHVQDVQTNIVIFTLKQKEHSDSFIEQLKAIGVRIISMGQGRLRMVTHMDVSDAEIDTVCQKLSQIKLA